MDYSLCKVFINCLFLNDVKKMPDIESAMNHATYDLLPASICASASQSSSYPTPWLVSIPETQAPLGCCMSAITMA